MGNCIQALSERVTLIASDDTWIEGNAIQQLHDRQARRHAPRRRHARPASGSRLSGGAAFFSTGRLYPALIGGDIGCGMSLWSTGIDARKAATAKLEKRLGDIDGPLDDSWQPLWTLAPADVGHRQALGTIGGGNHFAELQRIDTVCDPQAVDALGLDLDRLVLLVHSGSRGLGRAILEEHVQRHGHDGLAEDSAIARPTWPGTTPPCATPRPTGSWSLAACWTGSARKADSCWTCTTTWSRAPTSRANGLAAPQGATPSDGGLVVIPGSRGDFSYLVAPAPSRPACTRWRMARAASGCAASARTGCSSATARATRQDPAGSHVICEDKQLIYEEAPEAYKPVDSIIASLEQAGLLTVLAKLRPVLTYKTRGGCC